MPYRQKVVAFTIALAILLLIIELVRRRRLREEYSMLWIFTGIGLLILSQWFEVLEKLTRFIGAGLPVSTLFFFALIFLMLVSLQFSVKISALTDQVKNLAQKVALMEVKEPPDKEKSPEAKSS